MVRKRVRQASSQEGPGQRLIFFNGVDASSGDFALAPTTIEELAFRIQGSPIRPPIVPRGVARGIDPAKVEEAGWGILFAHDVDPAIRQALRPLIELRSETEHFHELRYFKGESGLSFLNRHGAAPGPVEPEKVPYYLLIVGDPASIPFSFQASLDVQHAVGRLDLPGPREYRAYARSLARTEKSGIRRRRRAALFGIKNPDDPATERSSRNLTRPLAESLAGSFPDWEISLIPGARASKAQFHEELHGDRTAGFIFSAGHAVCFSHETPELQRQRQGALLMSDWPGPKLWDAPVSKEHYYAASDLAPDASLEGLVSFHFACFSGGTPRRDSFAFGNREKKLAPEPFVARLPQAMLAHPGGSASAVIAHVDRAFEASFFWEQAGPQPAIFESTIGMILEGYPVGHAMTWFGQRYADLAVQLHEEGLAGGEFLNRDRENRHAIMLWTAFYDARGYILLGDPAARLQVEGPV